MTYQIIDVDLNQFLSIRPDGTIVPGSPQVVTGLRKDVEGCAVSVRFDGVLLDFLLVPLGGDLGSLSDTVTSRQLLEWLKDDVWHRLRQLSIYRQIVTCTILDDPVKLSGKSVTAHEGDAPSIAVVVCTRDRATRLKRCLASVMRAWESSGAPENVEFLIVENAPKNDETRQVVSEIPRARYGIEPVPGLNLARNRALSLTTAEIVAYIDDDVEVDRNWLKFLQRTWRNYPQAGGVTGQVLPLALETESQIAFEFGGGFRRGFERECFSCDRQDANPIYPCNTGDFGVGCNMSFRRQWIQDLGGFDDALDTGPPLPGGGDHDMLYRVVRSKRPIIYEPSCIVFHEHRSTKSQLREQYWSWGESTMAFAEKMVHTDRPMRDRWRRMRRLWIRQLGQRWLQACRRQFFALIRGKKLRAGERSAGDSFQEFLGACSGYWGAYRRSQRRIVERRDRIGDSSAYQSTARQMEQGK